jgi:hypothetical protein
MSIGYLCRVVNSPLFLVSGSVGVYGKGKGMSIGNEGTYGN